jgi:carbonic anhydrase/acetyltransferase-like protein (isoleucine patch superfamily)
MAIILPYKGKTPKIHDDAFIADNAVVIGDVEIEKNASIWFGCVVRGDVNYIRIGEGTNIQDGTIIHVHRHGGPTVIGKGVTVGHMALLHACTLEDYSFIGMGAKVIDYTTVETEGMVAAGAVLAPRKVVKSKQLWAGVPAKYFRDMTKDELDWIRISEKNYIELAKEYKEKV